MPRVESRYSSSQLRIPEVYSQLSAIYNLAKRHPSFPRFRCDIVSEEIERKMGLPAVWGWFKLDRPMKDYPVRGVLREPHGWNLTKDYCIVDETGPQFNSGLDQPIKDDILIICPGEALYERYIPQKSWFQVFKWIYQISRASRSADSVKKHDVIF